LTTHPLCPKIPKKLFALFCLKPPPQQTCQRHTTGEANPFDGLLQTSTFVVSTEESPTARDTDSPTQGQHPPRPPLTAFVADTLLARLRGPPAKGNINPIGAKKGGLKCGRKCPTPPPPPLTCVAFPKLAAICDPRARPSRTAAVSNHETNRRLHPVPRFGHSEHSENSKVNIEVPKNVKTRLVRSQLIRVHTVSVNGRRCCSHRIVLACAPRASACFIN